VVAQATDGFVLDHAGTHLGAVDGVSGFQSFHFGHVRAFPHFRISALDDPLQCEVHSKTDSDYQRKPGETTQHACFLSGQ
jgi:hypothetical protein